MLRTHQTRRVAMILVPDANLLQKRDPKNEEAMRQFIGPKKSLALGPRSRGLTHGRHLRSLYLLFGIGRAFLECLVAWLVVREGLVHRAVALDVRHVLGTAESIQAAHHALGTGGRRSGGGSFNVV